MKGGFLLVEASLAGMMIALALVTLVPAFVLSVKANKAAEQIKVATQLSTELLEEIRLRRWDELTPLSPKSIPVGSSTLGIDSGETASDKRTFDDIDDFNGWTESPPQDPMMQPLAGFTGYSRSVTVRYVDAALALSATPTSYKQLTVCTQGPKGVPLCLDTVLTNR
jgi:MSHA pilin protein MshD